MAPFTAGARVRFFVLLSLVAAQEQHFTRAAVNDAAASSSNSEPALVNEERRRLLAPDESSITLQADYTNGIPTATASGVYIAALAGTNSPTSFTLDGTDAAKFTIANTNELTTATTINYADSDSGTLTITVAGTNADGTQDPATTITITVLNQPTETYIAYETGYTSGIPDGTVAGTKIATLSGTNVPTSFTLGGIDAASFSIANNDELYTAADITYAGSAEFEIDNAVRGTYTITVAAANGDGTQDPVSAFTVLVNAPPTAAPTTPAPSSTRKPTIVPTLMPSLLPTTVPTTTDIVMTMETAYVNGVPDGTLTGVKIATLAPTNTNENPSYTLGGADAAKFSIENGNELTTATTITYSDGASRSQDNRVSFTITVTASGHTTGGVATSTLIVAVNAPPTAAPTYSRPPTGSPSSLPTPLPSMDPTGVPTAEPSLEPTDAPSATPTGAPTSGPSLAPTLLPTLEPTSSPTTNPTMEPSLEPTADPTGGPTLVPTAEPSLEPSLAPTLLPTLDPTLAPSHTPTMEPSKAPTPVPTNTAFPSNSPFPSNPPTGVPTMTLHPTVAETVSITALETTNLLYMVYNPDKKHRFSKANTFMNITRWAEISSSSSVTTVTYLTVVIRNTGWVKGVWTDGYQMGDVLRGPAWDSEFNSIQMAFDDGTGVLTMTGEATLEVYQKALRGVQFYTDYYTSGIETGNQWGMYDKYMGPMIGKQGSKYRTLEIFAYSPADGKSNMIERTIEIRRAGLAFTDETVGGVVARLSKDEFF